jgi:hypothetical protein
MILLYKEGADALNYTVLLSHVRYGMNRKSSLKYYDHSEH